MASLLLQLGIGYAQDYVRVLDRLEVSGQVDWSPADQWAYALNNLTPEDSPRCTIWLPKQHCAGAKCADPALGALLA